jgi:hypothetical protein
MLAVVPRGDLRVVIAVDMMTGVTHRATAQLNGIVFPRVAVGTNGARD